MAESIYRSKPYPAPVRAPEGVSSLPELRSDERREASDFEAGSYFFGGIRHGPTGDIYWSNSGKSMHEVLLKDVPLIASYIRNRVQIGDTENAQKAYNQIVKFTNSNGDTLNQYSRSKPSTQTQVLLQQRAISLLTGSFITVEDKAQLHSQNNPNHISHYMAETGASENAAMLRRHVELERTASNYMRGVWRTIQEVATVHRQDSGGVVNNLLDYNSTRANELLEFSQAAEGTFLKAFGNSVPDDLAANISLLPKVAFFISGGDSVAARGTLEDLLGLRSLFGSDVSVERQMNGLQQIARSLDRLLSSAESESAVPYHVLVTEFPNILPQVISKFHAMRDVGADGAQVAQELRMSVQGAFERMLKEGASATGLESVIVENAVRNALGVDAQVNMEPSQQLAIYNAVNDAAGTAMNQRFTLGELQTEKIIVQPIFDEITLVIQKLAVNGSFPPDTDYVVVMDAILSGSNALMKLPNGVRLVEIRDAAITKHALHLKDSLVTTVPLEQIQIMLDEKLAGMSNNEVQSVDKPGRMRDQSNSIPGVSIPSGISSNGQVQTQDIQKESQADTNKRNESQANRTFPPFDMLIIGVCLVIVIVIQLLIARRRKNFVPTDSTNHRPEGT